MRESKGTQKGFLPYQDFIPFLSIFQELVYSEFFSQGDLEKAIG